MVSHGPTADEAALLSSAQAGETDAFAQLFDRYFDMVHAFAYRLCLRAADADDIAQETFIRAARGLKNFRGGDFRSWLFRVAANVARDMHRGNVRRDRLAVAAAEEFDRQNETRFADVTPVHEALAALPEEQRMAVVLVYMEGLNHAEAARILDCAETTISWRLFRARRHLRDALTKSLP